MAGTVPPRLIGPRMAVWASFPFDNRVLDTDGQHADWAWAMQQWDRVAQAGRAVRLVVADQSYSRIDPAVPPGGSRLADLTGRLAACRSVEQLVFGRVYVGGGKLPLGSVGQKFDDPLRPGRQVPGVADQINSWRQSTAELDGIYLDSGPTDCTNPAIPGSEPDIPQNYRAYSGALRSHNYMAFIQAVQYPDEQGWLQGLDAHFLELWEGGSAPYSTKYQAKDACHPDHDPIVPSWWDPGPSLQWSRVHAINDSRDADGMRKMANLAIDKRGARTIWVTRPRQDTTLGTVFDLLPPYWADEVAFFQRFADQEEAEAKEAKDGKDIPDQAAAKSSKDSKDGKDDPDQAAKDAKDAKDDPDNAAQAAKDSKDAKDGKDDPDNAAQAAKDNKDAKDGKDDPDQAVTPKQEKDLKDFKDQGDKPPEFVKDSEVPLKALEAGQQPLSDQDFPAGPAADDDQPEGTARTFVRPAERPAVGEQVVADPATDPPANQPADPPADPVAEPPDKKS